MHTTTSALTPYSLEHVSDDDLHASTRRLVGRSNQLLAALLAHLAEVETRGIHRERACASLCTYCIYELRLSEDEAFRRARASKIARQFPILFEQVAAGEIHLTGILLLGPHLTEENHLEILARAKHRTKKELQRLVRLLHPLPDVPALIEPLGPAPRGMAGNPTWSQMVEAHSPEIRELSPGDRPKDWIADAVAGAQLGADSDEHAEPAPGANPEATPGANPEPTPPQALLPQRYRVQFTATQEYVDLLETAKDLLAHAVPSRSIEEVHLRALRALVSELKKRKTGAESQSRRKGQVSSSEQSLTESRVAGDGTPAAVSPRQRSATPSANLRQRGAKAAANPRQRGRYVSRAVRRAVWKRDGERCTYVDAMGQRCRETGGLELDHIDPHARGGPPTVANLRVRCRAHNALTAEHEFGRDFMAAHIGVDRWTAQHAESAE